MSKQAIIAVLILLLSAGAATLLIKSRKPAELRAPDVAAPVVEVVVVRAGEQVIPVETQGTVTARNEAEIAPEVAGTVVWVSPHFVAGGMFGPNEVLLRLDEREYRLAAETAKARVAQAQLRLDQVEAEAEQAQREWARLSDEPPPPMAARQPHVDEARASLGAAQADLDRAQLALSRTSLRAPPYTGVVQGIATGVGQFVSPGRPVAKVFALERIQVRLPFTDRQLQLAGLPGPGVALAAPLPVQLSALVSGRLQTWDGQLVRTEATMDPRTRTVFAVAEVAEDPTAVGLSVGQFVTASVQGRALPGVIEIPRQALRSEDRVYLVDDEDRLSIVPVNVLYKGDQRVAVDGGLADGSRVVLGAIDYPVQGMKVDARPVAAMP